MSRTQLQLWYNRLQEGQEDVNDNFRPGRPNTLTTDENVEAVKKMISVNRKIFFDFGGTWSVQGMRSLETSQWAAMRAQVSLVISYQLFVGSLIRRSSNHNYSLHT